MNVIKNYPPNFEKIKAVFPVRSNTVYTYGDVIYAPEVEFRLPPDLIEHERTHFVQQANDPESWWDRYLKDPEFRFNQELSAYRNQYRFYCRMVKDRNRTFKFLTVLARDLSSDLYGNVVDFFSATRLIKS